MNLVIWNKVSTDVVDVIIVDNSIKVMLNDQAYKTIPMKDSGDIEIYNELLADIEKINEMFIKNQTEDYQKLSADFFKKLEQL